MLRWMACLVPLALLGCTSDKSSNTDSGQDGNQAPVASAGADRTVSADETIVLDGSGSYDPDGDAIIFHWSFDRVPEDSALFGTDSFPNNHTSTNASELRPDVAGTYIVELLVEDAHGKESTPDLVVINVEPGDAPIANAGDDREGVAGTAVSIDGSNSYDPLGRELTFAWSLTEIPQNSTVTGMSDDTSATPSLLPDVGGRYVVSLIVNNGYSDSEPDTAYIDVVSKDPQPPVADAGEDISDAYDCTEVALDGSDSFDPNGDPLIYEWTLQQVPSGSTATNASFGNRAAVQTSFYPDVAGSYIISLAVEDAEDWSAPDLVTLTAAERNYNSAPQVEAGKGGVIDAGSATCEEDGYTYDCAACSSVEITLGEDAAAEDSDSDPLVLKWEYIGEGEVEITDDTALTTTARLSGAAPTEPNTCEETEFTFKLTATDCPGDTGSDLVTFVVVCCGEEPVDTGKKAR